jgi:hypothetical protein
MTARCLDETVGACRLPQWAESPSSWCAACRAAGAPLPPYREPMTIEQDLAALRAEVAGYVVAALERRAATVVVLTREACERGDLEAALRLALEHLYLLRRLRGEPLEGSR